MKELLSIQRLSLHDGGGIRTTVFLKGCPLRCPWCANPENLITSPYYYFDKDKCVKGSGKCILNPDCPGEGPVNDGVEASCCPVGAIASFGSFCSEEELLSEIMKDQDYFKGDGGVTFSGGEPLLHVDFLRSICAVLKEKNIGIGFETSLFVREEAVGIVREYADFCFADVKILDKERCRTVLGGDLDLYLDNLGQIKDIHDKVIFRVPIVPGYTDDSANIEAVRRLISDFRPDHTEIFSVHNLAKKKYAALGMEYNDFAVAGGDILDKIRQEFSQGWDRVIVMKI